jgi:hypothetical protein
LEICGEKSQHHYLAGILNTYLFQKMPLFKRSSHTLHKTIDTIPKSNTEYFVIRFTKEAFLEYEYEFIAYLIRNYSQ